MTCMSLSQKEKSGFTIAKLSMKCKIVFSFSIYSFTESERKKIIFAYLRKSFLQQTSYPNILLFAVECKAESPMISLRLFVVRRFVKLSFSIYINPAF